MENSSFCHGPDEFALKMYSQDTDGSVMLPAGHSRFVGLNKPNEEFEDNENNKKKLLTCKFHLCSLIILLCKLLHKLLLVSLTIKQKQLSKTQ